MPTATLLITHIPTSVKFEDLQGLLEGYEVLNLRYESQSGIAYAEVPTPIAPRVASLLRQVRWNGETLQVKGVTQCDEAKIADLETPTESQA